MSEMLHPTTEACLEMLQWLRQTCQCRNILDIGCGNGILSLAAASLWKTKVLAVDISQQAVTDTMRHCAESRMESYVTALRSDGFQHTSIQERAPYDLII